MRHRKLEPRLIRIQLIPVLPQLYFRDQHSRPSELAANRDDTGGAGSNATALTEGENENEDAYKTCDNRENEQDSDEGKIIADDLSVVDR